MSRRPGICSPWNARTLAAVIATVAAMLPCAAAAHPMGNFSINHYAAITVTPARVELRYLIDMAEIPTFQEMHEHGFAADPADPRLAAYLNAKCGALRDNLTLEADGKRLVLREIAHDAIFPPGAGGLPTMKLGMRLEAALAPSDSSPVQVDYRDLNFPGRAGWKEVIAVGEGGVSLTSSSVPQRDRSTQLSNYPVDLLNSPPQVLEAHLRPRIAAGAPGIDSELIAEAGLPLHANRIATPRNSFTELMTVKKPGTWFLLTAALVAIALGALHALEPGHGKTVVAAYLVGSRGTARHALMLAATVTASHTAGVYVLGALTLYASRWIIPERIYPWLGSISGMIVAGIGVALFSKRLSRLLSPVPDSVPLPDSSPGDSTVHPLQQFSVGESSLYPLSQFSVEEGRVRVPDTLQVTSPHDHGHHHPDGHHHPHDHDHSHDHSRGHHHGDSDDHHFHPHRHDIFGRHVSGGESSDGERLSMRGLLALGVTGGIVPCPAALVVLLSALSLNRAGFGLFLIVAFSAGLAAVLIGFGLGVVYARRFVARLLNVEGRLATRWLPLMSSAVITIAGVAITVQALANGGIIRAVVRQ
jgi:nickel/cobalt exporter